MSEIWPTRRSAALATLGVVAALLAGCSDDEPQTKPTASAASSTSSPEASATSSKAEPSPPALPAAAQEDTRAGAKAFVAWYLHSLAYAANTGDVSDLKAASSHCAGCADYISLYEKVYASGGFFRGVKWIPVTWSVTSPSPQTSRVLVAIRATEAKYKESAGKGVTVNGKYDDAFVFEVTRRKVGWAVSELTSGKV